MRCRLIYRTANELGAAVKNRLKRMQYRTGLIDGYLTGTGLSPPSPGQTLIAKGV
jgi:hypothetical protein